MNKLVRKMMMLLVAVYAGLLLAKPLDVEAAASSAQLSEVVFDADYYYNTYTDLQTAIGYDVEALRNHYFQFGIVEGRSGSEEFNCVIYMKNYSDLREAFGYDYLAYCLHYEQNGQSEGRIANQLLDSNEDGDAPVVVSGSVIGSYATEYNAKIPRATNVVLAASRINGVVVMPGQEFSFHQAVLPRTPENGYVEAPVIVGKTYVTGYGGGICQVSSTLYAAMLNAGLPATERYPHSIEVSYIPVGMDATISGSAKDLKFVNIFDKPLVILATTDETGTVTVSIVIQS